MVFVSVKRKPGAAHAKDAWELQEAKVISQATMCAGRVEVMTRTKRMIQASAAVILSSDVIRST